jgi:aminopeptidase N
VFSALLCFVGLVPLLGHAAPLAPDARGAVLPDRSFDMERLRLDLTLHPETRSVSGTATWTVRRLSPGPLVLHQLGLAIEEVTVDGELASWRVDDDTVVVEIAGAGGDVALRYHATPRDGLHFRERGPDAFPEVWSQGEGEDNRAWFPSWDVPNDRFVYEGTIAAPPGWKVLTNSGQEVVSYLVMVAAGPYVVTGPSENEVWALPDTTPEAIARVSDPVPSMMAHFAARTGVPYPWGPYRQVFVQRFLYSGMENTSATVEDRWMVSGPATEGTRRLGAQSVVAHELAHQWFGDLLTSRTWRELWLNEGFATFFADDWQATVEGPEFWAAGVRGRYRGALGKEALVGRFFNGGEAHNVYTKGAAVLQMLRTMLGDEVFWRGIRRYVSVHQHRLVETDDLRRAMEDESGQELGWFFQQWTELPNVPKLDVSHRYDGRLHVTVRQSTGEDQPAFTLPVEVEAVAGEERVVGSGWLTGGQLDLVLPISRAPDFVAFDPRGGLLADVKQAQDPAAWSAQLAHGAPYARFVAAEALGETSEAEALSAVVMDRRTARSLRIAAIRALGAQRATAALLPLTGDEDATVRSAVYGALGSGFGATAVPALQAAVDREQNPDLVGAALTALARLSPAAALPRARARLRARSLDDLRLVEAAANVIGEHGDAGDVARLLAIDGPDRAPLYTLRAAAAIVKRRPDDRDNLAPRVARRAEARLADLDLRGREAAVAVLGDVGDDTSVAVLERFRREERANGLPEAASAAITAIRSRGTPQATPNEVEARLEALERRLDELQKP